MKIFSLILPLFTMGSMIVGIMLTLKADEMNDNSQNQMEIIVDVWPKDILSGDAVYSLFSVKNKSQSVLVIQPLMLFSDHTTPRYSGDQIFRVRECPYYRFMGNGGWGEWGDYVSDVEAGIVVIQSGDTRLILTDIFMTTTTNYNAIITNDGRHVLQNIDDEPTVEISIANFAEKFAPYVQRPWPTINVSKRPTQEEWRLVNDLLHRNMHPIIYAKGRVETTSGVFTMQTFLPAVNIDFIRNNSNANLPNLPAWKAFEEKLSPGTLRDMIRLGRLQVQYLDDEQVVALDELCDWFAEMEPIQSTVLAASLCLPEGMEEESDRDSTFMFFTLFYFVPSDEKEKLLEDQKQAHKHYMAMRQAFDKIVRPYSTLPNRKLRETQDNWTLYHENGE